MIAVFDYGAGNLRSVENTLAELGAEYTLVRDSEGLRQASKIILPGVGHFGQMMRALDALAVRQTFLERIGAVAVIAVRQLDGIARIAQVDEVDTLHNAPGGDVQAGDDALG